MAAMAEIDRLLIELETNQKSAKLSLQQLERTLGKVKVFTRDPVTAGRIANERGIGILSNYGFDTPNTNASLEAQRCIANLLLINESSRQTFVQLGYAPKAAERLKLDTLDDEFLSSRILFLMTYGTRLNFDELFSQHQLADTISMRIAGHAKLPGHTQKPRADDPMEQMAFVETLKLLFNLTNKFPESIYRFAAAVQPLMTLLINVALPTPPLQPPIPQIINALLNLSSIFATKDDGEVEAESKKRSATPPDQLSLLVDRLGAIFDVAIQTMSQRDLDQAATPLCTLLRLLYDVGPSQTRSHMQSVLLPQDKDRERPLGQSETLPSRLLRLSNSPSLPLLQENVSSLLFEMSDKDAEKFIRNVGYGFASGFLMSHNLNIPMSATSATGNTICSISDEGTAVNPTTGQKLSAEARSAPKLEEMTEEEKEREAERLFVLFERLKATGVMDVKNPVQQALDEGRFEEIE